MLAVAAAGLREEGSGGGARPGGLALKTAAVETAGGAGRIEVDGIVVGRLEAVLSSRLAAPVAGGRAPCRERLSARARSSCASRAARRRAALESARAALAAAAWLARRDQEEPGPLREARGRGAAAATEIDRTRQEEAAAAAAVASAEAGVRRAETDRAEAVLTAPFDAVVVEKMVSQGDLAAPGRPLVRLASLSGRRVEAAPGEEQAARLSPGDAGRGRRRGAGRDGPSRRDRRRRRSAKRDAARCASTCRRASSRRSVPSRVCFCPGPPAERLLVPARAVVARGGLEIAWAVGPDGRVALRYVRTGAAAGGGTVEVRSGLAGRASAWSWIPRRIWRPARECVRDDDPRAPRARASARLAGRLARAFVQSKLTPLVVLFALGLGALAIL